MPMTAIIITAGMAAEGALPKFAIPAGKLNTPTPTIALTRLKTSLGMVAVPPLTSGVARRPRRSAAGDWAALRFGGARVEGLVTAPPRSGSAPKAWALVRRLGNATCSTAARVEVRDATATAASNSCRNNNFFMVQGYWMDIPLYQGVGVSQKQMLLPQKKDFSFAILKYVPERLA